MRSAKATPPTAARATAAAARAAADWAAAATATAVAATAPELLWLCSLRRLLGALAGWAKPEVTAVAGATAAAGAAATSAQATWRL